jgi:circadian clock protein KaiC
MAHSNQVREFQLTNNGINLVDVYVGPSRVFTGSARIIQEAKDRAKALADQQTAERKKRDLQQEKAGLKAQVEALTQRIDSIDSELNIAEQADAELQKARRNSQNPEALIGNDRSLK